MSKSSPSEFIYREGLPTSIHKDKGRVFVNGKTNQLFEL